MSIAGVGPLSGAIAFVDRGQTRYAVAWVAWKNREEAARAAFADAVSSWLWSAG
jgi:hypothetical protein